MSIQDSSRALKIRIQLVSEYYGISIAELERRCGFSKGYFSHIRRQMSESYRTIFAQRFPDVNMQWLISGDGVMISKRNIEPSEREIYEQIIKKRQHRIDELEDMMERLIEIINKNKKNNH